MLLVTGGIIFNEYLDSTEVYRPSTGEWREVSGGALPRTMAGVRVVTLNERVLLFGEKEILFLDISIACIYNTILMRWRGQRLEEVCRNPGVLREGGGRKMDKSWTNGRKKESPCCFNCRLCQLQKSLSVELPHKTVKK